MTERLLACLHCPSPCALRLAHGVQSVTVCELLRWPSDSKPVEHDRQQTGREKWRALHSYAESYPETPTVEDQKAALVWFASWQAGLRDLGCDCSGKWAAILRQHPLDLSSRRAFYQWSVCVHDEVNVSLGKPRFAPHILTQPRG